MTMRSVAYVGTVTLLTLVLGTQGCGSNSPVTTDSTGGVTSTGGATVAPSNGGATTPATTGAGGATTPVTTGAGGATTPATTSAGGATTPVTTSAGGATTPTGGTTGTGTLEPICGNLKTVAGLIPSKGILCPDAADPQLCYKTCGPNSIGSKSETCTAGSYVEQPGCTFPTNVDFSCYKIPTTVDPSCPTTAPTASQSCTVAPCTLCGGTTGYFDSGGASKVGYCVCPTPSATTGLAKWSCASATAWPCPAGQGC